MACMDYNVYVISTIVDPIMSSLCQRVTIMSM